MSRSNPLGAIAGFLLLGGCASFGISGDFQSGRQAMLANQDEQALGYFQRVAENDPSYVFSYELFREGIWTYLGRVQYRLGRYDEARQSLERALSSDRNDNLARLYIGLTLARRSGYAQGLKDIQAGLQGLYDWLDYMQSNQPYADFWDPLGEIHSEIKRDLDIISGKDIDWPKLIESAEWVGQQMDEEVNRVRRDEEREWRKRDFPSGRGGVGIGVGIGF